MKAIMIILMTSLLTACAPAPAPMSPVTVVQSTDSQGRVVQETTTMDGRAFADVEMAKAHSECVNRQKQPSAEQPQIPAGATTEQITLFMAFNTMNTAIAALATANQQEPLCDQPTNSNDAEIVRLQTNANVVTNVTGAVVKGVGIVAGAALASDVVGALAGAAASGGVTINGDNNGVRGANTGENGNASYTESRDGIPLNPAEVNPVTLDGTNTDGFSNQCSALGGVWIAAESRCSDGNGGTISL